MTLFTTYSYGQTPTTRPVAPDKEVAAISGANLGNPENKVVADAPKSDDVDAQIAALKAENADVREQLGKLLEIVERLQKKLESPPTANANISSPPSTADAAARAADVAKIPLTGSPKAGTQSPASDAANGSSQSKSIVRQFVEERYQDGIVIWKTPDEAKIPFALKFNINTQFRYLNTLNSDDTFVDHLGNVRAVNRRNDLTVNRSMFALSGYIFDKRLQYSYLVWTAAGAASIAVAGSIGWRFNRAFTLTAGYNGAPGSRTLAGTFPFFTGVDRSMSDNFFRPGFSQGIWATGEPVKGLYYQVMLGNGLNQLNVSAFKFDTNLMVSGSAWWEPLGEYGEPGKARHMYDDYFAKEKTRIRIGTGFTISPGEDRFSNIEAVNPENTALYNSDGVLTFSTGAFAPGVTVDKADYKMWAIDGGIKRKGLAVNGQYYMRWVDNFVADGPIPLTHMFDHGFELFGSYFIVPRKLMAYARTSMVFGHFNNSWEYSGGVKWHFLPTERLWLQGEVMRVNRSPYSGAFTPYSAGLNGWVPMIQTVLAF